MKYIIMCGGEYKNWKVPRQALPIQGEPLVARTIRLLRENGVEDIAISSNDVIFEKFGVPVLHHDNYWKVFGYETVDGLWVNAFYPTDYPVCYLLGDIVFSHAAMRTIVNTDTKDIEFFASAPPFAKEYPKEHAEPIAFKVVDTKYFRECINVVVKAKKLGLFYRNPIAWELWQVIKKTPLNFIDYSNYTVINDYTCDIDNETELHLFDNINMEM